MRLLIISGSRNPEGQTARAAAALETGAKEAGAETEVVYLPAQNIERCRQCEDDGWGECRNGQKCVIEDDFPILLEKVRDADTVAFANPVYFGDLSESLRAFLDRLRRVSIHGGNKDRIQGKPVVGVCVAGGGGGGAPKCTQSIEFALTTIGFDVVDVIAARRQNLDMKLEMLPIVGRWLCSA